MLLLCTIFFMTCVCVRYNIRQRSLLTCNNNYMIAYTSRLDKQVRGKKRNNKLFDNRMINYVARSSWPQNNVSFESRLSTQSWFN